MVISQSPLISIIVPVYNVEKYLEKSVGSILSQTYKNLEIILVNDGSTDNCLSICRKLEEKDKRIKVIDKPNGGLSSARNAGIDIASGDYIGFVDSDDWIEPMMYEKLLKALLINRADISICGISRDYTDKEVIRQSKDLVLDQEEALIRLFANFGIQDYAVNKLYKKRLWDEIRFPIGKFFEDILTTYKVFLKSQIIAVIKEPYYHYVQREGSIARGTISTRQLEMLHAIETVRVDPTVSQFRRVLNFRVLKIKYTLLWYMLVLGDKKTISEYDNIGKQFYHDICNSRIEVLISPYSSKSFKLFAVLSVLPYSFIKILYLKCKNNT